MVSNDTKNQKEVTRNYTTAGVVLVVAILITILGIAMPAKMLWDDNKIVAAELDLAKDARDKLKIKLENLENLKKRESELKTKNEKVLEALPKDSDIPRLFVQFDNIGNQAGLTVEKATEQDQLAAYQQSTSNQTTIPLIEQVLYEYNAKADSYFSVKDALQKFENALRLVSIKEITLDNTAGISIKILAETYKRNEK